MVFFTCDYCNESLKKNQVEKHVFKCRNCMSVTCIDCGVSFYGDDYAGHLVCVSEAEKYEKSLYKKNEKLSPQDAWMQAIAISISDAVSAPADIQKYLPRLSEFNNIPRNKKKFGNFLANSLRIQSPVIVDGLWNHISSHAKSADDSEKQPQTEVANVSLTNEKESAIQDEEAAIEEEEDIKRKKKKELKKEKKRLRGSMINLLLKS